MAFGAAVVVAPAAEAIDIATAAVYISLAAIVAAPNKDMVMDMVVKMDMVMDMGDGYG